MSDAGDKVSADIKKPIQDKIDELKKIKDGEDTELIKKTTEELSKVLQTIGEAMQKMLKVSKRTHLIKPNNQKAKAGGQKRSGFEEKK